MHIDLPQVREREYEVSYRDVKIKVTVLAGVKDVYDVAIMILNRNGVDYLKELFPSLVEAICYAKENGIKILTVLVDNGSSDDSVSFTLKFMKEHGVEGVIIKHNRNLGFAKAYNLAAVILYRMFMPRYFIFLNNDVVVEKKYITIMVRTLDRLRQEENVWAGGGKILLMRYPNVIQYSGALFSPIGGGLDKGLGSIDSRSGNDKIQYTGAPCGASMIVCSDVFVKLGGFENTFFAYFEDVDLGYRIWSKGGKVIFIPDAKIYHHYGGSFGKYSPIRFYLVTRNRIMFFLINYTAIDIIKNLPLAIMINMILFILFSLKYGSAASRSFIKAFTDIARNMPAIRVLRARREKIAHKKLKEYGLLASLRDIIRAALARRYLLKMPA